MILEEASNLSQAAEQDLILIDVALSRLAAIDERKGKIVELKFLSWAHRRRKRPKF